MRLFVSVDLPDDLADEVAAAQDRLRDPSGLRFTDPEQAHVTLQFLGDVPASRLDELREALDDAVVAAPVERPFDARFEGLGVFPNLGYISVVWLGVADGSDELAALHEAVEAEFADRGFEGDDHEFTPHVTLARMEHAGGKDLVREAVETEHPVVGTARVESVRLTESTLADDGPAYETVHATDLR